MHTYLTTCLVVSGSQAQFAIAYVETLCFLRFDFQTVQQQLCATHTFRKLAVRSSVPMQVTWHPTTADRN